MPPKNFRKMSDPELEIYLYLSNFSKEIGQLTDIQEICSTWTLMIESRVATYQISESQHQHRFFQLSAREREKDSKIVSEGTKKYSLGFALRAKGELLIRLVAGVE